MVAGPCARSRRGRSRGRRAPVSAQAAPAPPCAPSTVSSVVSHQTRRPFEFTGRREVVAIDHAEGGVVDATPARVQAATVERRCEQNASAGWPDGG
eukprot:3053446-Pleurochrysis_carterae.AAC.1